MPEVKSDSEVIAGLAEEFIARYRNGERPSVSEYTARHPELAGEMREFFAAVALVENLAPADTDSFAGAARFESPAAMPPALAHLGDYRIIREVGRGRMGIVYEAEQVSLGRHVALKVLPRQLLPDGRLRGRFAREARAAARLHHTNIVPVFSVGEQEGTHYYVMQFIQGLGLDQLLEELRQMHRRRKFPADAAAAGEEELGGGTGSVAAVLARSLALGEFDRTEVVPDDATHTRAAPCVVNPAGTANQRLQPAPSIVVSDESAGRSPVATDTTIGGLSNTSPSGAAVLSGQTSAASFRNVKNRTYWQSVAHIGVQVASALHYAHEQGILHRDIKPGNLLLDLRGTVWVTDFGLAKSSDQPEITHTENVLGTLRYMPAEAFDGKMDPRSDVYSLGLTLYELLALKPAFDESDRYRLIRQVTRGEPVRLEKVDPRIPRDLATIVHKAIDRDRARRYQTAAEMQWDLERFMAGEPVKAHPLTLRERGGRWCRHNPALALLSSVLMLALTGVAAAMTYAYFRESAHRIEIENKNAAITEALQHEQASKVSEAHAKEEATRRLYRSLVGQARANRLSRRIGQRVNSLEVLSEAARMARDGSLSNADLLELRNEAIAAVVLPDVRIGAAAHAWPFSTHAVDFTGALDRYACVDREGTVSIHRTEGDAEIWKFPGSEPGVAWPLFSPDGRFLAVWDWGRSRVKAWRIDGPGPFPLLDEERMSYPVFRPDSRRLVCRQDDSIVVFDLDSAQRLRQFRVGYHPGNIAYHPAGRRLAITAQQGVQIIDEETGTLRADLPQPSGPYAVAWHPDGQTLAAVGRDAVIQLWDVASSKPTVQLKGHNNDGIVLTFSHDGNLLASTGWDHILRLWEPRTGELLFQIPMTMEPLRFSADDRLLAAHVSEATRQFRMVEIVRACGYRTLVRDAVLGRGKYFVASTSPDDRLLAVGMHEGVAIWDLVDGRSLTFLPCGLNWAVLFEPSGALLTQGSGGLVRRAMEFDSGSPGTVRFGAPRQLPLDGYAGRIGTSRDGRVVAKSMGWGGLVWHEELAQPALRLEPHFDARYIAVSPDGRLVATASHTAAGVKVWDALTGKLVREFPAIKGSVGAEFSPDGRWLAASDGRLWEVDSWREAQRFDPSIGLAFSPDSQILAMETGAGIVRLVDPESGREYARLEDPHQDAGGNLCFSHDGTRLVATGNDSATVQIWDLRAIRRELRDMGLDWDLPPYSPSRAATDAGPVTSVIFEP